MVAVVLAPALWLAASWLQPQWDVLAHLAEYRLPKVASNTFWLALNVAVFTGIVGVAAAWLTTACEFPGRALFEKLLVMPLAIPGYVMAFVFLGMLEYSGPLQTALRDWFDTRANFFPWMNHPITVSAVFSLVLYPYVYLLARSGLQRSGRRCMEVARSLGMSPGKALIRVVLPLLRPAIFAGVALAVLESVADFGTVATFNYDTLAVEVYRTWFSMFNLAAAAQLASGLLLVIVLLLLLERKARGARRFTTDQVSAHRLQLSAGKSALAIASLSTLLLLALVIPLIQLSIWTTQHWQRLFDQRFVELIGNTLSLATMAAVLVVAVSLLLVCNRRANVAGLELAGSGYALPGTVLATGVMLVLTYTDGLLAEFSGATLGLASSVPALLLAYMIRFLRVALSPLDAAARTLAPSVLESAQLLERSRWRRFRQVQWPTLSPAVLVAVAMVAVEVIKEMPATLMLRPFGWDTLATHVYELTSEGQWQWAAGPGLLVVLCGAIPVWLLVRKERGAV